MQEPQAAGGPPAPVHPYLLGRSSLEELAGEVLIAFGRAARVEAEGRGTRPSIGGLRTLLDAANGPESPFAPQNDGGGEAGLLASLPHDLKGWFRREFVGRTREERGLMTGVASELLLLPHLKREAEEALGLKRPIPARTKLAGILAVAAAYPAVLWGMAHLWGLVPSSGGAPGTLASVAIIGFVVLASWPPMNLIRSWGLTDFRPRRAGRCAFPAILAYCCALAFLVDLGFVSPPGIWA